MTIRLLTAWDIYPINAIVHLSLANEAGLVATGTAEANLCGGVVYEGPRNALWKEPAADAPQQA